MCFFLEVNLYVKYPPKKAPHMCCYTNTEVFDELKSSLTEKQYKLFSQTCFGRYLEMQNCDVQAQLFRCFMARELKDSSYDEFKICVNGAFLRFTIREFAIISGLNCVNDEDEFMFNQKQPNRLLEKYFGGSNRIIKKSYLIDCFKEKRWGNNDEDAIMISVLYFINTFLLSGEKNSTTIPRIHFDLVESGRYSDYPWGKIAFSDLIKSISQKMDSTKKYFRIHGMPFVMQVWFYECSSSVDQTIAIKDRSEIPRILNWRTVDKQPKYQYLMDGMFREDTENSSCTFGNIVPSLNEVYALKLPSFPVKSHQRVRDTDFSSEDFDDFTTIPPQTDKGKHQQHVGVSHSPQYMDSSRMSDKNSSPPVVDPTVQPNQDATHVHPDVTTSSVHEDLSVLKKDIHEFKEAVDNEFKDLRNLINDNFAKIMEAVKGRNGSEKDADSEIPININEGDIQRSDTEKLPDDSEINVEVPVVGLDVGNSSGDTVKVNTKVNTEEIMEDHVRVHRKFFHSNATSHKWALGAFAELLDNAMDEVCYGATYVSIDVLDNKKEKGKMILVEDNGGGMTPDKMRACMSLGYSPNSKLANTIGQYGNGFRTSSMRLGADVIVFSRCQGMEGISTTQSVGMLSYTFLRSTGKEDIVVPMIDFVKREESWEMLVRSSADDWQRNSDTIVQWSPYESEEDLFQQFELLNGQGTQIIIYNLWEDEEGATELDFDTDPRDIQIRGVTRDEKIEMAKVYPNSRHFLTYQYSLRSYASILYLRLAPGFRIILRGKDIEHHNLVDDMMLSEKITYRPQPVGDQISQDPNAVALVTIGFVKDAKHHIDIQGFNVYHKNRLIKPFLRVWDAAGSDGRGVIGVLEANFVEPAHDKQGFERTIVLARLEARLLLMQKKYWSTNCHLIGYAKRSNIIKNTVSPDKEMGPVHSPLQAVNQTMLRETQRTCMSNKQNGRIPANLAVKLEQMEDAVSNLREENHSTKNNLQQALQYEKDKNKNLKSQLKEAEKMISDLNSNHDNLARMLIDERIRWDKEEESLRNKLQDAADTIEKLINKVNVLENRRAFINIKRER